MGGDYLIGQVPRRRGEALRVCLTEYKGRMYADLRVHFPDEHDVLEPSRKGVMLTPADVQQVLPLLTRACALLGGKMLCGDQVPVPRVDEADDEAPPPASDGHQPRGPPDLDWKRPQLEGRRVRRVPDGSLVVE